MGDWKYATAGIPKRTSSRPGKVFGAAGGILVDTSVLVADTCITPVVSLVPALAGPPAVLLGAEDDPFLILTPLFYPWYLCSFGGYGGDEGRDLRDFYGDESERFKMKAPTPNSSVRGIPRR